MFDGNMSILSSAMVPSSDLISDKSSPQQQRLLLERLDGLELPDYVNWIEAGKVRGFRGSNRGAFSSCELVMYTPAALHSKPQGTRN